MALEVGVCACVFVCVDEYASEGEMKRCELVPWPHNKKTTVKKEQEYERRHSYVPNDYPHKDVCGKKPGSRSSLPLLDFFLSFSCSNTKQMWESVWMQIWKMDSSFATTTTTTAAQTETTNNKRRIISGYQTYKNSHFFSSPRQTIRALCINYLA